MGQGAQDEAGRGCAGALQGQDGVGRDAGEERARGLAGEPRFRQATSRPERQEAEARHPHGMARDVERGEHVGVEAVPSADEGLEQPPIGGAVWSQPLGRCVDGALDDRRRPVVERMREGQVGVDPIETVLSQRQRPEKGEPAPRGWMAEQTSWRKPGSVSSSLLNPPPMESAPSRTSTLRPARARVSAAARPLGPEPTTTAS